MSSSYRYLKVFDITCKYWKILSGNIESAAPTVFTHFDISSWCDSDELKCSFKISVQQHVEMTLSRVKNNYRYLQLNFHMLDKWQVQI